MAKYTVIVEFYDVDGDDEDDAIKLVSEDISSPYPCSYVATKNLAIEGDGDDEIS